MLSKHFSLVRPFTFTFWSQGIEGDRSAFLPIPAIPRCASIFGLRTFQVGSGDRLKQHVSNPPPRGESRKSAFLLKAAIPLTPVSDVGALPHACDSGRSSIRAASLRGLETVCLCLLAGLSAGYYLVRSRQVVIMTSRAAHATNSTQNPLIDITSIKMYDETVRYA